jgi:hypothetical protein
MRYVRDKPTYEYYTCSTYQNARHHFEINCSRHAISRKAVEKIALAKIQEAVAEAISDKKAFAARIQKSSNKEIEREIKVKTAEATKGERRLLELDKIIKRIYEDNINGKIDDGLFRKFLDDYQTEQSSLKETLQTLRDDVETIKAKTASADKFLQLVERHSEITELTPEIARLFIEKILVFEAVYTTPEKRVKASQEVAVYFNHIGIYES